jgi:hypothetical protein
MNAALTKATLFLTSLAIDRREHFAKIGCGVYLTRVGDVLNYALDESDHFRDVVL